MTVLEGPPVGTSTEPLKRNPLALSAGDPTKICLYSSDPLMIVDNIVLKRILHRPVNFQRKDTDCSLMHPWGRNLPRSFNP